MLGFTDFKPFLMSALFVIAISLSKSGAGIFDSLDFAAPFILLFIWAVYSEEIGFPIVPLILGFVQDALAGTPFGLWPTVYLSFYVLSLMQMSILRTAGMSALWVSFMFLSSVGFLGLLGLVGLFESIEVSLTEFMHMAVTAWLAFPLIAYPLRSYLASDETGRF